MKMQITLIVMVIIAGVAQSNSQGFDNFISTKNGKLYDGVEQFRFISYNIPNLNYVEDEMSFEKTNPYDLPNEYEIRDAMESIRQMGGRVIRFYTIPVRNKDFPKDAVTYVEGPGEFNEEAFRTLDRVLALANEYGIRLIFPLLNNWQWMGGAPNYAAFRGKSFKDFYTDKQLIADFKITVEYVLTRKNTITGIQYKDDKSIMCWETGNELQAPYSWTKEIVAFIKKFDNKHLVMDGFFATGNIPVMNEALNDPNIDIVSSHHYESNPGEVSKNIRMNVERIKGKKPYIVGEFGFFSTSAMESIADTIIANEDISGGLTWSLRYHHRNGGFYWHSEPLGNGLYKAYHWPGFESGKAYDEKNFVLMFQRKAFEIQKKNVPPITIPSVPILLPTNDVSSISWQGSAGASGYTVERAEDYLGRWEVIGNNVSDAIVPNRAQFQDKNAEIGKSYYYRVAAVNNGGVSPYSNIMGPVIVVNQTIIDNMENIGTLYTTNGTVIESGEDRSYKEILHRAKGDAGAEIIYFVPKKFLDINVFTFETDSTGQLRIETSNDRVSYSAITMDVTSYTVGETIYNYAVPRKYFFKTVANDIRFIKLSFQKLLRVARVEIRFQ